MQDIVRTKLAELVGRFGLDLCNDPRRCEALLRDACPEHKREISALVAAVREGIASEMLHSSSGTPKELLFSRLTKRLYDNLGLDETLARWAVESWALALGVTSIEVSPGTLKDSWKTVPTPAGISTTSTGGTKSGPPRGMPATAQTPPLPRPSSSPPHAPSSPSAPTPQFSSGKQQKSSDWSNPWTYALILLIIAIVAMIWALASDHKTDKKPVSPRAASSPADALNPAPIAVSELVRLSVIHRPTSGDRPSQRAGIQRRSENTNRAGGGGP